MQHSPAPPPTYQSHSAPGYQQPPPDRGSTFGGPPAGPYAAAPPHQQYPPSAGPAGSSPYPSGPMMNQTRAPQASTGMPPVPYKAGGPPGPPPHMQQHQQQLGRDMYPSAGEHHQPPPPLRPVFGVSLQDLFVRDQSPVPMVVYQCVLAVDQFGLDVEGIYRVPGTGSHIMQLKALFDNGEFGLGVDWLERGTLAETVRSGQEQGTELWLTHAGVVDSSQVDFRNPENFFHDVNSVAGLLKQFFRDLPDPLFSSEHYLAFIDAARKSSFPVLRLHTSFSSP